MKQIQTPGGAFWQRDTVCTIATFDPYEPIYGNGDIEYSCRKHSPDGAFNNASGMFNQILMLTLCDDLLHSIKGFINKIYNFSQEF